MRPDVCRFVSEIVYDNRLDGLPELAMQATVFGMGLRFLPVDHVGNVVAAPEEAELIAREIQRMRGGSWTNRKGETRLLAECDFMVVAPYNAQVRWLRQMLQAAGFADVLVGTVDKFQGREVFVVFYSMATSSAEEVLRSLEFLFSRNRFNVAVLRAMCLACIVVSPRLLESCVRMIEQMRLINVLCRFAEMVGEQGGQLRDYLGPRLQAKVLFGDLAALAQALDRCSGESVVFMDRWQVHQFYEIACSMLKVDDVRPELANADDVLWEKAGVKY